jgi:predicted metalloprotease with PDZ domain
MSDFPIAMISYNYGEFDRDTTTTPDSIPIEVYRSKAHHALSSSMLENVLLDLRAATSLFSLELERYPFPRLLATEIQSGHGQGMPGFLHLAWSTFESQLPPYDDAFRAHEVAHQWWRHLVGWQSYHDQWLSEGFAEYMGAWYVQRKYLNNEKYRGKFSELMDRWREDVLQSGGYNEGNKAGPIWMGLRLASSKSEDYTTLVYSKGAYVLYMLRMMMFDFNKRDDSKFNAMLKDFLEQYSWKEASTSDFIRVAEKHYGSNLDWFFNEWIYSTQLPTYKWTCSVTQEPDGRYVVNVDIQTDGVSPTFRMLVPFTILMEGDYHTTVRLDIDATQKRITLPKVPYKPAKFIFNPYKSVLCKDKKL